jgi:uncharacterized repeat protein (TIGR04076 family)
MENKVKVTVLRRFFYADLAEEYLIEGKSVGACPLLKEGDVFLFEGNAVMPENFCPWTWIDIYKTVSSIFAGATYSSWNNREHQSIICCTDGIRPVVFKVEWVEQS